VARVAFYNLFNLFRPFNSVSSGIIRTVMPPTVSTDHHAVVCNNTETMLHTVPHCAHCSFCTSTSTIYNRPEIAPGVRVDEVKAASVSSSLCSR
jgi:hypothetical protein